MHQKLSNVLERYRAIFRTNPLLKVGWLVLVKQGTWNDPRFNMTYALKRNSGVPPPCASLTLLVWFSDALSSVSHKNDTETWKSSGPTLPQSALWTDGYISQIQEI